MLVFYKELPTFLTFVLAFCVKLNFVFTKTIYRGELFVALFTPAQDVSSNSKNVIWIKTSINLTTATITAGKK